VRRTLAALARPNHAKLAAQLLYNTVDEMWRAAGDTSTDYNFYTKRATLSAVYSATLLAFLSDNSADMANTKAFLDRRLKDVSRLSKITRPAKGMAGMAMRAAGRFAGPIMRGRRAR
jgi:ubiquinone biosynthesis protein COQ9